MKKSIVLLFLISLGLILCACGEKKSETVSSRNNGTENRCRADRGSRADRLFHLGYFTGGPAVGLQRTELGALRKAGRQGLHR